MADLNRIKAHRRDTQLLRSHSMEQIDKQLKWIPLLGWCGFIIGLALYIFGLIVFSLNKTELADLGTFLGGAVSSIWSAAGFVLVYAAFLGQRRQLILQEMDLDLQRQDLRASRREMHGQREALEEQVLTARNETASIRFFNLLHHYTQMVNAVVYNNHNNGELIHGRNAIERALANAYERISKQESLGGPEMAREIIVAARSSAPVLGVLIRNLDLLMAYSDQKTSTLSQEYIDALSVQLSPPELNLWVVTCFGKRYGSERKRLTEKYGLLRDHQFPVGWDSIMQEFTSSAYIRTQTSFI